MREATVLLCLRELITPCPQLAGPQPPKPARRLASTSGPRARRAAHGVRPASQGRARSRRSAGPGAAHVSPPAARPSVRSPRWPARGCWCEREPAGPPGPRRLRAAGTPLGGHEVGKGRGDPGPPPPPPPAGPPPPPPAPGRGARVLGRALRRKGLTLPIARGGGDFPADE